MCIRDSGKAIGDCMDLSTADRMMIQVPMFHCFGMVLALSLIHIYQVRPIRLILFRAGGTQAGGALLLYRASVAGIL